MKIIVHGPEDGRPAAPVSIPIPHDRVDPARMIGLVNLETSEPKPLQVDSRGHFIWWEEPLEEDEIRTYRLHGAGALADSERVVINEFDDHVTVTQSGERIATYRFGADLPRPYVEDLSTPRGVGLTRPVPAGAAAVDLPDPHHRGCWTGWADVNGVDHWHDGPGCGQQRHRRFGLCASGPVLGRIGAVIDWLDPGGRIQLTEQRLYTFYVSSGSIRIVDLVQRFGTNGASITFGDTPNGGLCALRVAPALSTAGGGRVSNSEGETGQAECWGSAARWCHYGGSLNGASVGAAVLDSPLNIRHPTHWLVTDSGLMAANPFGLAEFVHDAEAHGGRTWQHNDAVMFRYRLLLHDGPLSPMAIEAHYSAAAHAVHVDVE